MKIKGRDVIFYLLMELQSGADFQMPYRLLVYMMGIWRDVLKNIPSEEATRKGFRLPPIIPIILYNGRDQWTACRSFKETLAEVELFGEYLVDFKYILIDVNRYDKKTLMDLANLIGAVFLLDQEIDSKEYRNRLLGIAPILRKFNANSFQLFKSWLKVISSVNLPEQAKQEIIKIINESTPEEAEKMVTNMEKTLRNIYEEGLIDGKTEVAKNLLSKNIAEDLVAETTGLPVEQIRKLKSQLH